MNSDEEKISDLYREAEAPVPSKQLDDAILAASRDAVAKPAKSTGPFSAGWPALASIAAVIVITIILIPTLIHEQQQPAPEQIASKKSRPAEINDELGLSTYTGTETMKQSAAPSAEAEPVISMEQDLRAADRSLPAPSVKSPQAVTVISKGEIPQSTSEQGQTETVETTTEASRLRAADSAPFAIYTPEMWEVKIARLLAEGKLETARAEIKKLESYYPQHQINPAILKQLNAYYE